MARSSSSVGIEVEPETSQKVFKAAASYFDARKAETEPDGSTITVYCAPLVRFAQPHSAHLRRAKR